MGDSAVAEVDAVMVPLVVDKLSLSIFVCYVCLLLREGIEFFYSSFFGLVAHNMWLVRT